jgi:hypothetical protein
VFYRVGTDGKNPAAINLKELGGGPSVHGCNVALPTLWLACDGGRGGTYPDCPHGERCSSVELFEPNDSTGSNFRWVTNMSARLGYGVWSANGHGGFFISPSNLTGAEGEIGLWKNSPSFAGFHIRYGADCQATDNCPGFGWDSEIPDMSPDGRYLYLSLPAQGNSTRRVIGRVDLTRPEDEWEFEPLTLQWQLEKKRPSARFPTLSPDGTQVAFVARSERAGEGTVQLFVMPADASRPPRQLTHVPKGQIVRLPVWR